MDFDLGLGEWIIIGISAFLFLWYYAANSYNRRRGIAVYRWLQQAFERLGEISHSSWIGSSSAGARMSIERASRPFRKVQAICLLEPREFLPYWIFNLALGKREMVKIQFTLRSSPKGRLAVVRTGRRASGSEAQVQSTGESAPGVLTKSGNFQIRIEGEQNPDLLEKVQSFLHDHAASVTAIELKDKAPHLEIQTRIGPLLSEDAEAFIEALRGWFLENDS